MRNTYVKTLYDLASKNKNIFAIVSDYGIIAYDNFIASFPEQYINMGISEANAIACSAGLASMGRIPYVYTVGAFLAYRAFEFIRNDICMQNQNVKLIGAGAGMSYSTSGPTHHCTEDLAVLRVLPNLTILSPSTPIETAKIVEESSKIAGPVYIRLGIKEIELFNDDYEFELGKNITIRNGNDIAIFSTGSVISDVLKAYDSLVEMGISARIINVHTVKPFDRESVIKAAIETKGIITVEEHNVIGGIGSAVSEVIAESGYTTTVKRVGLNEKFALGYGTHSQIKALNGISPEIIKNNALEILS